MVFKGQDAWRKHPLLTGCSKVPFPHFGLAVKIFAGYLLVEAYVKYISAPPEPVYKPKLKYLGEDQKMVMGVRRRTADDN